MKIGRSYISVNAEMIRELQLNTNQSAFQPLFEKSTFAFVSVKWKYSFQFITEEPYQHVSMLWWLLLKWTNILFFEHFQQKGDSFTYFSTVLYLDLQKKHHVKFLQGTLGSRVILATHAFPLPDHFRKISYWEAKIPLTIPWQSSMGLYEKTKHAFVDNFLKLCTKHAPPAPSRTPFPCSTNVSKEHLSYFDSRIRRTHNKPSRPNIQVIYN